MACINDRSGNQANGANQCDAISTSMWKAQLRGWFFVSDGVKSRVPTIAEALWRACARLVSQSDGGEGMNGRVMENARNRIHQEVTAKWALLAIPQTLAISRKRSNTPSEGKGHTFESCRVRHKIKF
jgi:hypothetical protein